MSAAIIQPLTHALVPTKQKARRHYGSHPYFTKRAWNVVQAYIEHFSSPGETVLDPFGGSGVTAVEALVLGRKALYADISPWACFLARQTAIAPVNLGQLEEAFGNVEDRCRVYLEEIGKTPNSELEKRPIAHWYPKNVSLPPNSDVQTVEELFTPRMLHGLAALRAAIMEIQFSSIRDLLLLAFSATLARINRTFLSTTYRKESRGGSAIFSIYRYKVAKKAVELPLWCQFAQRFTKLREAKKETNQLIGNFYQEDQTAVFRHTSASRLDEWLAPESVNYIYTDPPYGGHIAYLDLSTMWAAWLGLSIEQSDRDEEVIEGGQLRKTRQDYDRLLSASLGQMHRVLKAGRWLSLVFAHRDIGLWDGLVRACQEAGFTYVNTVAQPVGVVWSMHKKKNPLRVLSGELVLNFRKGKAPPKTFVLGKKTDPLGVVKGCCEREIIAEFGASTEDLHHALVPRLLETGLLADFARQWGDLTPLLEKNFQFDKRQKKWHLPEKISLTSNFSSENLLKYLVVRYLQERAEEDGSEEGAIQQVLQCRLGNGKVNKEALRKTLKKVAYSVDGKTWRLGKKKAVEPVSLF